MSKTILFALCVALASSAVQADPRSPRAGGQTGIAPEAIGETAPWARSPKAGGETGLDGVILTDAVGTPRRPRGGQIPPAAVGGLTDPAGTSGGAIEIAGR